MPAQQALPWDMPQPELEGQAEALPAPDGEPQIKLDETSLAGEYLENYSQKREMLIGRLE